jgi:hypothetical protein
MSHLRKEGCYRMRARLFRTLPREDWIRWYVLPGVPEAFPGVHKFGGLPWAENRGSVIEGPGELHHYPFVWDPGLPPLRPAEFRGELGWFRDGIPDELAP